MDSAEDTQISCKFITKLPSQYQTPETEIAVPSKLTRYGLSQIVNHLLALESPVPFDFLVNGVLIRLTLGKVLVAQNISAESVLEIEYIFAVTPPEWKQRLPHDDWVSAVNGSRAQEIYSGCYDGSVKSWDGSGNLLSSVHLHDGPVSTLESIGTSSLLLSSGKLDHLIKLLQVPPLNKGEPYSVAIYKGHAGSVFDVAASPTGKIFASASQDKTLKLWGTGDEVAESAKEQGHGKPQKKKQRLENGAAGGGLEMAADADLAGHADAVTSVTWQDPDHLFSGSMDHSVRRWDAETRINVDTHNDRRAVFSVAVGPDLNLVAFGGADKSLQIWDPRQRRSETAGVTTFTSHSNHVTSVSWHSLSSFHLLSASLDKTVRLWDTRSTLPLHILEGHTEQVLDVKWWQGDKVISGSADNSLRIYQTSV